MASRKKFKVAIDEDLETGNFIAEFAAQTKKFGAFIESLGPQAGAVAEQVVRKAIREQMPNEGIGAFMEPRTGIDVHVFAGSIVLTVYGLSEGEAGHPKRSDGTVPKVKDPNTNLWVTHEFGEPSDGRSERITYVKDAGGGVKATREGAAYGAGSPYVGEIRNIIQGLTRQLEAALMAFTAIAANEFVADAVETASKGKIIIERSARAALKRAGVSLTTLKELDVAKVMVRRGRILLFGPSQTGAAGAFRSGQGRVPTKIRK